MCAEISNILDTLGTKKDLSIEPKNNKLENGFIIFGEDEYTQNEIAKIKKAEKTNNINRYMIDDKPLKYRYYAYFKLKDEDDNGTKENKKNKILTFILFNPSNSNHKKLDQTTNNCLKIASNNHYSSMEIINLYPFRSSKLISEIYEDNNNYAYIKNINLLKKIIENKDNRDFVLAWGEGKKNIETCNELIDKIERTVKSTEKCFKLTLKSDFDGILHPSNSVWNGFGGINSAVLKKYPKP